MLRITHNEPDFVHAPPGSDAQSFWAFAHDARVQSVKLDDAIGECSITVTSPHISLRQGWERDTEYELAFLGATHVAVGELLTKSGAPAPARFSRSSTAEEVSKNTRERTRVESRRWSDLELAIEREGEAYLYDGGYIECENGAAAWLLVSLAGGNRWMDVTLAGLRFEGRISRGHIATLFELEAMGRAYWDSFGETEEG